jgi:hypothetical protein
VEAGTAQTPAQAGVRVGGIRRLATETKNATKTTEFWAYLAAVVAILISAAAIKGGDTAGTDEFVANQAWLYVTILTAAYCVSRGLAKSGSSEPYTEDRGASNGR